MKSSFVALVVACFGFLFSVCYGPALIQGRQFGFRDAGHFYYPLYQRVQAEWNAGRWPLWEPEENAGMPLLGNPAAAVLYPGKLIFFVVPYAWGARLYIVMHTGLAFVAMVVLLRSWGISWPGTGLGALGYTFGTPILFQYSNVIYLVGAAWLPLGVHAVDRWARRGRRWGLWELATVLAMQVLGGDPQSAYLLGLAGIGYAMWLAWGGGGHERKVATGTEGNGRRSGRARTALMACGLFAAVLLWSAATIAMGILLHRLRETHGGPGTPPLRWTAWIPVVIAFAWGLAGLAFVYVYYGRRGGWRRPLGAMFLGLLMAAAIAASLTAAQLFPVIEFTRQSTRAAAGGVRGVYHFSVEPYRLAELIWPNVAGPRYGENSYWPEAISIPGVYPRLWVPSLYLGGMIVILAIAALAARGGPPWRGWLTAIALVGLLGSLGQYTSPIWVSRAVVGMARSPGLERLAAELGPVDPPGDAPIRPDGFLKDGDGSLYWWLTAFLPGFSQFRFPAKLFSLTALAIAALAAVGWDRVCAGRGRHAMIAAGFLMTVSVCLLAAVVIEREPIQAAFESFVPASESEPLHAKSAYAAIVRGLVHGALIQGLAIVSIAMATRWPWAAGAGVLIATTLDLAAANSGYVMTVEQSLLDGQPAVARIIEKAEAESKPAQTGPFRVHRMPSWNPRVSPSSTPAERFRELVAWEHDTIRTKYGIDYGIQYTYTTGVAELADYQWYFSGYFRVTIGPVIAKQLGTEPGKRVIYFPRRAYDLWNTRYFVVPAFANGWNDDTRASAAFRFESEVIYPEKGRFDGRGGGEAGKTGNDTRDFEVVRNNQAFPRAWVVHRVRAITAFNEPSHEPRAEARREVLYPRDVFWTDPRLTLYDPHSVAWISRADLAQVRPKLSGAPPGASEAVTVHYPSPQHAVLEVTLESPGLVILSDVDYPGWRLTIDGVPAPIYRVNVLMRGAVVAAGPHRLEYSFAPRSFHGGLLVSIFGVGVWILLGLFCAVRPVQSLLATDGDQGVSGLT